MRIYLLMVLLSFALNSTAQLGVHFADSNAVWKINYRWLPPSPYGYNGYAENYISGDTTINDILYKKIGQTGYDVFCTDIITSGPYYMGALREDTALNKVFFIPEGYQNDMLLYDYNLQVGDTLPQGYNVNFLADELFVNSIDTFETNGVLRQRWNLEAEYMGPFASIIEGIGSTTGLLEEIYMFEADAFLRCYFQNDIAYYTNSLPASECVMPTDSCFYLGVNEQESVDILCYPNPAKDVVNIAGLDRLKISEVRIYDQMGRQVFMNKLETNGIDISGLNPGMYFLHIKTEEGIASKKLIVK